MPQELTDKINDTPQPTKLATVQATGKVIEITECIDYNPEKGISRKDEELNERESNAG